MSRELVVIGRIIKPIEKTSCKPKNEEKCERVGMNNPISRRTNVLAVRASHEILAQ